MTVFVGPSIWRQINVRTATAIMSSIVENPTAERVIWAPLWNDALIGRSRSIMCTEFLKTDADVMVIIDDDIVFEWPDFWKIVEGARETRGVYGGAYVTRSTEPHISSRSIPGTGEQEFRATPNRRPVEYQYLATGFWAVHRDAMEAMIGASFEDAYGGHKIEQVQLGADRPFYPFFSPFVCREDDGRLHYLSEDWAFSNRARQLGFKVWVDLSIILLHMGEYPYSVADLTTLAAPGLPSTGIDWLESAGTPTVTGDPLLDNVVQDMADFTEDDPGDVRRMMYEAPAPLFRLWEKRNGQSEADWYKREDVGLHYLADLAAWHQRGGGILPDDWIASMAGKRVIDFGAGNGHVALQLARAGAYVLAVETNPVLREFIAYRAEKYGIHGIQLAEELSPYASAEAIVCWHVFEHVEDPAALLDMLLGALARDGVLMSQSGFEDTSTPMHHSHPDWEEVLRSRGLIADPDTPWLYHRNPALVTA